MLNKANEFPNMWQAKHNVKADTHYIVGAIRGAHKYTQKIIMLHRWLMDAPESKLVDHRNHDPLDNRLENLRLANYSQNGHNRKHVKNVYKDKNAWRASITLKGVYHHLGLFKKEEDAILAVETFRKENDIWLN